MTPRADADMSVKSGLVIKRCRALKLSAIGPFFHYLAERLTRPEK
jgi:hypothetical protein